MSDTKENKRKQIVAKYLAIAQRGVKEIWDEYYSISMVNMPQKEAYKLVSKYHVKVRRFLDKINRQGLDELRLVDV